MLAQELLTGAYEECESDEATNYSREEDPVGNAKPYSDEELLWSDDESVGASCMASDRKRKKGQSLRKPRSKPKLKPEW